MENEVRSYPECDKLAEASEESNKIGQFLDWMCDEKDIRFAKAPNQEEFDALEEDGVEAYEGMVIEVYFNIHDLLAEYFNIDLNKVEKERQQMLENIRNAK